MVTTMDMMIAKAFARRVEAAIGATIEELQELINGDDPTIKHYRILETLPTVDFFEGMVVYTTEDNNLQVCTGEGSNEYDRLTVTGGATADGEVTITLDGVAQYVLVEGGSVSYKAATLTHGATSSGDITVTLNGVPKVIAVVAGDTADDVATKIYNAYDADPDWDAFNNGPDLNIQAAAVGADTGAFTIDGGTTGVTCTGGITEVTPGADADTAEDVAIKIVADLTATLEGWTMTRDGTEILFAKVAVGECEPPIADGGTTGVTFGDFEQVTNGVDTEWSQLINEPESPPAE